MIGLTETRQGQSVIIRQISGDRRFLSRITSIGLGVGCRLEVMKNERRYPLLVYGRDTMIALNRKECERIVVEEVAAS